MRSLKKVFKKRRIKEIFEKERVFANGALLAFARKQAALTHVLGFS